MKENLIQLISLLFVTSFIIIPIDCTRNNKLQCACTYFYNSSPGLASPTSSTTASLNYELRRRPVIISPPCNRARVWLIYSLDSLLCTDSIFLSCVQGAWLVVELAVHAAINLFMCRKLWQIITTNQVPLFRGSEKNRLWLVLRLNCVCLLNWILTECNRTHQQLLRTRAFGQSGYQMAKEWSRRINTRRWYRK